MAFIAPVLMYVSAGIAAYSAIQQGKAAEAAAAFNEITNRQNAEMSRSEARMRASQTERETMLRLGAIRAAQGASGGTGEGSVLDVIADSARQGELERQYEIYRGEAAARGYKNTATLDARQGSQAAKAGYLRAGQDLLGGAYAANRGQAALVRS